MTHEMKRKRTIYELTGMPDDIIWYTKRQRTRSLWHKVRDAVKRLNERLRPWYYWKYFPEDYWYPIGYVSRDSLIQAMRNRIFRLGQTAALF